eukprot:353153-Chlamydomonas_euryale.AAC.1
MEMHPAMGCIVRSRLKHIINGTDGLLAMACWAISEPSSGLSRGDRQMMILPSKSCKSHIPICSAVLLTLACAAW